MVIPTLEAPEMILIRLSQLMNLLIEDGFLMRKTHMCRSREFQLQAILRRKTLR